MVGNDAHQRAEALDVVHLFERQHEGDGASLRVASGVELGGEITTRASERLGVPSSFFIPSVQWCARTTVLSIMSALALRSTTSASFSSMASNTPVMVQQR